MVARTFNIQKINPDYKRPIAKGSSSLGHINTKDRYLFEEKTLEIDRLDKRDTIGDYCFIFKEPLPYSIVSLYPVKLLKIPLAEIKTKLDDDQLMEMVEAVKLYPKDEDIIRIFHEKQKWLNYCEGVVEDLHNYKNLEALVFLF